MAPKRGRYIFTSVFTAFQLPKRICSEWLQKSVAAFSCLLYQHSSSQRGSVVSESKSRAQHFHFRFISIPAPMRLCSEWRQKSLAAFSPLFLQHSSSQRGSADGGAKPRSRSFHFCFTSIAAPKEDLQMVAPNLGRACFTTVLSAFQLPKRICSE